ncbi:hypothetical protein [Gandjariella thermophila]|uniref:Uncharacterized protein n=1 Tax=Gandjariella thermophila TaxID=1931992 RepID=A0A4D4J6S6_9PSEU|nr:hypothetical protein [Gandjariella thermophila]GDY29633.1 hypothetical protein GTS_12660 [Gandjariella thermophila]
MDTTGIPHPPGRIPLLGDVRGINYRTAVQDSLRLSRDIGPIFRCEFLGTKIVTD